jgi:hypothetical protein
VVLGQGGEGTHHSFLMRWHHMKEPHCKYAWQPAWLYQRAMPEKDYVVISNNLMIFTIHSWALAMSSAVLNRG